MKRWVVLTVLLYALALLALTEPSLLISFAGKNSLTAKRAAEIYLNGGYWFWLGILMAAQALFLLLPLKISQHQFIPRRTLKISCAVTAFLLANLFFAGTIDILCATFKEEGMKVFSYLVPFNLNFEHPQAIEIVTAAVITVLALWMIWTIVFRHFADTDDPDSLLRRAVRWLLVASVFELLVAIPCHVVIRRDNDLAPAGTFWGIANSIAVILLCMSANVYFLFAKRFRQPRPQNSTAPHA